MNGMSDIALQESVKMVKDEEEIENMRCKAKTIAYARFRRKGKVVCVRRKDHGETSPEVDLEPPGMTWVLEDIYVRKCVRRIGVIFNMGGTGKRRETIAVGRY